MPVLFRLVFAATLPSSVFTPADPHVSPLISEGANIRSVLDKAVQSDQVVKDRYNAHCDMIALLCKPENELAAALPSANPTKTLQGSEVSVRAPTTLLCCSVLFHNSTRSAIYVSGRSLGSAEVFRALRAEKVT